jgi:ABC-type lipoprotein export system ATPase subunit
MLLRHRAVLVVTRDAHLLAFADRVIYIEDGFLTRQEWADADRYRRRRTRSASSEG